MLLYSTLLCKKIARATGGHKRFMLTKLGGGNRIDRAKQQIHNVHVECRIEVHYVHGKCRIEVHYVHAKFRIVLGILS